jgi:hypothetical protein
VNHRDTDGTCNRFPVVPAPVSKHIYSHSRERSISKEIQCLVRAEPTEGLVPTEGRRKGLGDEKDNAEHDPEVTSVTFKINDPVADYSTTN